MLLVWLLIQIQFFFQNWSVYADGSICLDILQNQWSPIYDVAAILTSIQVWLIVWIALLWLLVYGPFYELKNF